MRRRSPDRPAPDAPLASLSVLGLKSGCTRKQLDDAFRRMAKAVHPDKGGDPARFHRLQSAYDEVDAWLRRTAGDAPKTEHDHPRVGAAGGMDAAYRVGMPLARSKAPSVYLLLGVSLIIALFAGTSAAVWRWAARAPFRRLNEHRVVVVARENGGLSIASVGPGVPSAWEDILALGDQVVELDLGFRTIDAPMIEGIASLTSLSSLDLSWSTVNDDAVDALAEMPNLARLRLDGVDVTSAGVARLYRSQSLRWISVVDSVASYEPLRVPPHHIVVQRGDSFQIAGNVNRGGPGVIGYVEPDQALLRSVAESTRELGGVQFGLQSTRDARLAEDSFFGPASTPTVPWGDEFGGSFDAPSAHDSSTVDSGALLATESPWSPSAGGAAPGGGTLDPSESFLESIEREIAQDGETASTRRNGPYGLPSAFDRSILKPNLGPDSATFGSPGLLKPGLQPTLPRLEPPSWHNRPSSEAADRGVPWAPEPRNIDAGNRLPWRRANASTFPGSAPVRSNIGAPLNGTPPPLPSQRSPTPRP